MIGSVKASLSGIHSAPFGELIAEAMKLRHVDVDQGYAMLCVEVAGKVAMWQKVDQEEKKANSSGGE